MHDEGLVSIQTQNVTISAGDDSGVPSVEPGDYVLLTVTDSGEGMSEEVQRRLFEPFFTTKPVGKGTGLGLAMVHGIVHRSGGSIRVKSFKGKGTSFRIYLPHSTHSKSLPRNSSSANSAAARLEGGTETVLLVEDDETVRGLTSTVLKHYGYNVIEASNGPAALQAFIGNRERIHLIITDIVMAGMNGTILVEQIHKLAPGIPVLYISGYIGETATRERLVDSNANFLQKPFEPHSLAIKVREVLDLQAYSPG